MFTNSFRVFTYTTSKRTEKVLVNIDNISNIVQDGDSNCLVYFTGDRQDCVRVDGTLEDVCMTITGSIPNSLNPINEK